MIPRFKPWLGWAELSAVFRPNIGAVERFEKEFARTFNAVEAVSFPYGRSALWAFLNAVGVRDAEVVMPAYTCSVVAHAISLSGNRPRFVDIRLGDYNMDLDLLSAALNERTRAVVATHLFGYPLDLSRLEAIISEAEIRYGNKIWLIQDCAHSFGATWKGRLVGNSGDVALYGLNISKMITSIFGGMLTFTNASLAAQVRSWRDATFTSPSWRKEWQRRFYLIAVYIAFSKPIYGFTWWLQQNTSLLNRLTDSYHLDDKIHFPPDYKEKMLNIESAVGLEQLKKYPKIIAKRRSIAKYYNLNLPNNTNWILPPMIEGATYSHYVVRVTDRRGCVLKMAALGLHLGELIQYSVAELGAYKHFDSVCPIADYVSRNTINIPITEKVSISFFAKLNLSKLITTSELDRVHKP